MFSASKMVRPIDSGALLNCVEEEPQSEKNVALENAMKDYMKMNQPESQLVKLPRFMPSEPNLWFDLIEIIFEAQKITEQKLKYASVIMAVETELILEMDEIFKSTKSECNYDILKSKILEKYKNMKKNETKKTLSKEKLRNRTPSEFLQYLQNAAGDVLPESDLQDLLIQCLPNEVQVTLEKQLKLGGSVTLENMAKQADILMDFYAKITGYYDY